VKTKEVKVCGEVWHGTHNSFVIVEESSLRLLKEAEWPGLAQAICPHLGVDGILIVKPLTSRKVRMILYNPDGSRAEMCGNGIRCVAAYALEQGWVKGPTFTIVTDAGNKKIEVLGDQYRVNMGPPIFEPEEIPVHEDEIYQGIPRVFIGALGGVIGRCVSMGNPHVVIPMAHLDRIPLSKLGVAVENDPHFPNRVNTEFVDRVSGDPHRVKVLVWERGAGPTKACGTGACAVAVVGIVEKQLESPVQVELPGGTLSIEWDGQGDVFMTGPAEKVAESVTYLYKPVA